MLNNEVFVNLEPRDSTGSVPVVSSHAPKVRLEVTAGPGVGQTIELRRVVSIIGSGDGSKVRLKHGDVSSAHAAIVNTGEEIYLRDLASRTGTFLNDLRAEHERLQDGDAIKIRPWQFRVGIVQADHSPHSDFTGMGLEPAPTVVALLDPATGNVIKLPRQVSLVGRRHGCDLLVDDRAVSRAHTLILTYLSDIVLYDLFSHNGTFVNGQRVTYAKLEDDDLLTFAVIERKIKMINSMSKVKPDDNGHMVRAPQPEDSMSDRIDIGSFELDETKPG